MRILEFTLVGIHSLDLTDILTLSKTSKGLWKAMRSLTEMHCTRAVTHDGLNKIISFFSEVKLLSLNSSLFDWGMTYRIFDHTQISLLRLKSLRLIELSPRCYVNHVSQGNPYNSQWAHIRSLDFHDCQSTGLALEGIIVRCQNIFKLSLHGCIYIKDRHISEILSKLLLLETLDLSQLLGMQLLVLNENQQRSLKFLRITKCSFLRDIITSNRSNYSLGQSLQSLMFVDCSCTSVDSYCLQRIVSNSPRLETLIAKECSAVVGTLTFISQSVLYINLQHSCNMTKLRVECPNLNRLDIQGCLTLKNLTIRSLCLRTLDLAMLVQLSVLEMSCPCVKDINFSGCRKLRDARVSSRSPFSESFPRKYYRDNHIEEKSFINDADFLHFGCLQLKVLNESDPTKERHQQTHFAKVRSVKFSRRSSSI